jgi:hydroxymethylbilane synthase
MDRPLTIGAHESGLARAEAEYVAGLLPGGRSGYPIHLELFHFESEPSASLHDDHIAENRDLIRSLHERLRSKDVDVIIHQGFDLRDRLPGDLHVAAVLPRRSPYDALLSPQELTLEDLDPGAPIGVVQLRARAQLRDTWPDLNLELILGDVGSWLTALIDERIQALVAPNAAMERLGLQERVSEIFPPEVIVPAPCSGIVLCVIRQDDEVTHERLQELHHAGTEAEYAAETAFMDALGGRWESPIGSLAQCVRDQMSMLGFVASPDGSRVLRKGIQADADDPVAVGETLAELLLDEGAHELLELEPDEDLGEAIGLLTAAFDDDADWNDDESFSSADLFEDDLEDD